MLAREPRSKNFLKKVQKALWNYLVFIISMKTLKVNAMKTNFFLRLHLIVLIGSFSALSFGQIKLSGFLLDSTTRAVITQQQVILKSQTGQVLLCTSDSSGAFTFKSLKPGHYVVEARANHYQIYKRSLTVTDKNITLKVLLQRNHVVYEPKELHDQVLSLPAKSKEYELGKRESFATMSCAPPNYNYYQQTQQDFNTENYQHNTDNGYKNASENPLSTLSIDVDRASYSNVRRFLNSRRLPPPDAVRVEELINYFPYNYPEPKNGDPFSISKKLTECPWNKAHQLIHVGIKGKEIAVKNMQVNNLVFLIDVSGSMSSPDKLPLLKSGLQLLVDQMRPQDKISLVAYAGAAGLVLAPTDGQHKEEILHAIERLESGGSTAGGAGISLAYQVARENFLKEGNNRIILATDGDFNVGASSEGELVRMIEKERESGVFLTVLGFGTGNIKDAVMEQLADKGNGNYAYIDNLLEAKKVLVNEMGGTIVTIASDVKIQVEFNPAKVKAYRLVGYENRLLNAEDFNDDKKDAGELGSGHTVTALYEIIPAESSETIPGVDALKCQQTKQALNTSDEVMTIKFRYKEPGSGNSKLITSVLKYAPVRLSEAGEDVQFATAVAGFGLLLRNSEYKGTLNYADIRALALRNKGQDEQGYRAEFVGLVDIAEMLSRKN